MFPRTREMFSFDDAIIMMGQTVLSTPRSRKFLKLARFEYGTTISAGLLMCTIALEDFTTQRNQLGISVSVWIDVENRLQTHEFAPQAKKVCCSISNRAMQIWWKVHRGGWWSGNEKFRWLAWRNFTASMSLTLTPASDIGSRLVMPLHFLWAACTVSTG